MIQALKTFNSRTQYKSPSDERGQFEITTLLEKVLKLTWPERSSYLS